MGIIWPTRAGSIQGTVGEACQIEAWHCWDVERRVRTKVGEKVFEGDAVAVEERVGKLEGSMEDVKKALDVEGRIDNWKEQSRDYVKMSLNSTMDKVNELFDSHKDKLLDRNNALEAMVGEGVASAALSNEYVPELKEFVETKSACDMDNFLWRMENYFHAKGIMDDAAKVNTASLFLTDIVLLWWRGRTTNKRQGEIETWQEFQCELKGHFYPEFPEEEA
ncbi:hypothetical protein PVK06_005877 [Gossypium arboreum]|uniref:Uncharacterized protein n=1 Tax=Gossypium arboreum TaxID=29729 RepID=A0ABR0QVQ5_GOSAR|nr:hypothetical protein PVK06_005877 [Gossypium arboreum]